VLEKPQARLWKQSETHGFYPATVQEISRLLGSHGFDLRVSEDNTKTYIHLVLTGLNRCVHELEGQRLTRTATELLANEVELWARRLAALEAGVKHMCFHSIKAG